MTAAHDPRILVVDDDPDICRNLSDILTDLGYTVDFAHDGPSALELVRRRPYDVALLDLKMPGMDGLTLYREIKKQRAGTVALLVTAYASPATADEALCRRGLEGRSPSRSTSRSSSGWSTRRSASRWSWSSTTTATSAPTSGTCSASVASASAWHTTPERRPTAQGVVVQGRPDRHEDPRRRRRRGVPDGPRGEPAGPHDPDHGLPLGDGPARRAGARRGGRRGLLQAVRRPGSARGAGTPGRGSRGGARDGNAPR